MTKPIALQLYSLREELAKDFERIVRRVAEMGYIGVEPWSGAFASITPQAAAQLFKDLGLQVIASHVDMPEGENTQKMLDIASGLGIKRVIVASLPPEDYASVEIIQRTCERLNQASAVAKEHGLELLYHNHWQEYGPVDGGRSGYQVMLQYLNPDIRFEVDTYWVKAAGHDPAAVLKELGARVPMLHIKDGPAVRGQPMTAVGDGTLDIPGIIHAGEPYAEWMTVEIDRCATNMLTAVQKSYDYLVKKGLARGNKG
jgi:sugar phosphate isomerase/epimerase